MQSIMVQSDKGKSALEIASEVRAYFEHNRVSQKQVSVILGVTQSTVSVYLAGRPFSDKIANKWAEAFGFSQDFLVSGVGVLVPEATEENKYPRTAQLTTAQTCLIAQGYNFMSKEKPDEKEIPIAAVIRSAFQGPARNNPGGVFGIRFSPNEDNTMQVDVMTEERVNIGDIYKWQDEALKSMREQMAKKEERLLSIESIIGKVIGLGADTVSALPTNAISTLLFQAAGK